MGLGLSIARYSIAHREVNDQDDEAGDDEAEGLAVEFHEETLISYKFAKVFPATAPFLPPAWGKCRRNRKVSASPRIYINAQDRMFHYPNTAGSGSLF